MSRNTRGDRVEIRGFGSFRLRHYGVPEGRNPRTGAPVQVAAKTAPLFRAGKDLLCAIKIDEKPKPAVNRIKKLPPAKG
ncbi:HU family DNA-binding protein [Acidiphilium acidophilum]|uniref:HU family DNA-binding protein n=1 Tax=Acidiphilium acidophilum TaxID=76588 RepID=UPI002E8E72B5|nr:HU family DNA-binding protein [Acidiphilium acidophilum]